MNKKVLSVFLVCIMMVSIVACSKTNEKTDDSKDKVTIKIMSWLSDPVQKGIEKMNQEFMEDHENVEIVYEAITGDDYRTVLQTRFASGDGPDIFMNAGYSWLDTFQQYMAPLTDEEWVQYLPEISKQRWGRDGEYYGFPVNLQSISFVYNKDLFQQAGITEEPRTFSELKAACEKIKEIGVTPFGIPGALTARLAHSFNVALGHHENPIEFIEQLRNGETTCAEDEAFNQWADFFEYTIQNSTSDILTCDDDSIYTMFATGQVAIIQAGSWCESSLKEINPDLNIGIIPMSINDNVTENVIAGDSADGFSVVNNENTEISKELVAYWALSDSGKDIFKEYQMIPAMKNCNYDASELGQILEEADIYFENSEYFGWYWYSFPDLTADMQFGAIMQSYISGEIGKQEMLQQFDMKIAELEKKAKE